MINEWVRAGLLLVILAIAVLLVQMGAPASGVIGIIAVAAAAVRRLGSRVRGG